MIESFRTPPKTRTPVSPEEGIVGTGFTLFEAGLFGVSAEDAFQIQQPLLRQQSLQELVPPKPQRRYPTPSALDAEPYQTFKDYLAGVDPMAPAPGGSAGGGSVTFDPTHEADFWMFAG